MTDVSIALRDYAGRTWPTLNHKGRMAQLARRLGLGHRRVRSIYQNEPGVALRAEEASAIAALRQEQESTTDAYLALETRVARLEAYLATQDEGFHGPQMAALGAVNHARRGQDDLK